MCVPSEALPRPAALEITTSFTPWSTAENALSSLLANQSLIISISRIFLYCVRLSTGITLSGSSTFSNTPLRWKQYINVTSYLIASDLAISLAIASVSLKSI